MHSAYNNEQTRTENSNMNNIERLLICPSEILDRWLRESRAAGIGSEQLRELEDLQLAVVELEETHAQHQQEGSVLTAFKKYALSKMSDEVAEKSAGLTPCEMLDIFIAEAATQTAVRREAVNEMKSLLSKIHDQVEETKRLQIVVEKMIDMYEIHP